MPTNCLFIKKEFCRSTMLTLLLPRLFGLKLEATLSTCANVWPPPFCLIQGISCIPHTCPRWLTSSPRYRWRLQGLSWSHLCPQHAGQCWRDSEHFLSPGGHHYRTKQLFFFPVSHTRSHTHSPTHTVQYCLGRWIILSPGQQGVEIVWCRWIGAQRRRGDVGSCLGPVLAPVVGTISP